MAIQYLLPCSCGRKTPVETRQAGGSIVCECGATLDIPRLLEMKRLEKVPLQTKNVQKAVVWGAGHKLLLSGVVVLVVVALLWNHVVKTSVRDISDDITPEQIRAECQKMSPLETWAAWTFLRDNGINPPKNRFERYMEGLYAQGQMMKIGLGCIALGGVTLIAAGIVLIRRKRPQRSKPGAT